MADISFAAQAKSDQLNAVDILGYEPILTISEVRVNQGDQPVWIYYHGCNNRPWKPSRGMIRILMAGWGRESDDWTGKSVQVFTNPEVKYAGKEVGGIQVRAMSDIPQKGMTCPITINRQKREAFVVKYLDMTRPQYPQDKFDAGIDAMAKAMQDGKMTLQQVIARCQQTGDLTQEQLAVLQSHAPIEMNEEDEEVK